MLRIAYAQKIARSYIKTDKLDIDEIDVPMSQIFRELTEMVIDKTITEIERIYIIGFIFDDARFFGTRQFWENKF